MLKTLYCYRLGYDARDFGYLRALERGDGGYFDTHFLLGLLFLEKNGCYDRNEIERYKWRVTEDILQAARQDEVFSDLYAKRIVFLSWAGRGNEVKKE